MGGPGRFGDRLREIKNNWQRHDFYTAQAASHVAAKRAAGAGEGEAREFARMLLAAIDSLGFVPRDGKFKCIGNEPAAALGLMS